MESGALVSVRLQYYSFSLQFYYCICRITESSLMFQLIIFYRLTHAFSVIISYDEKKIFYKKKKKKFKSATWRPSTQEKLSNVLRYKKAYGLQISQNIIYVKEYLYMFFSTLRDIVQANKTNKSQNNTTQAFGPSESSWTFREHSDGTRVLGHLKVHYQV